MSFLHIEFEDNSPLPAWAKALNAEAALLDPLSDSALSPPTMKPKTTAELVAIDEAGV